MKKTLLLMSPLLWLACCALPAHAGSGVWRCAGSAYSDTPCSEGRQVALADGERPAADVAAAKAVAAREQRLADELRAERLQREAAVQPLPAARAKAVAQKRGKKADGRATKAERQPVRPKTTAAQRPAPGPAAAGTWRAVAPASPRAPG